MTTSMLLLEAARGHAHSRPDAPAVVLLDDTITWSQLWTKVCSRSNELVAHGVKPKDRVTILAKVSADYIASILACAQIGAICAPLSLLLNQKTLVALLADANPNAILLDDAGETALGSHTGNTGKLLKLSISPFPHDAPDLESCVNYPSDAPMSLIYSSGTTGVPKGILHSRSARDHYATIFAIEYGITQNSVTLLATPPYSNGTWMMMLPTLLAGGCCVINPNLKTQSIPDTLSKYDVSHAFLVPTQLDTLFAEGPRKLTSEKLVIVSAGAFLPLRTKRAILESPNIRLFELYGNTEGVCSILRPHQMVAGFDSVGTAITAGELAISDEGEILGRNPLQSMGYYNRPDLTRALWWKSSSGEKYVRSGDLGKIGKDRFLRLSGRIKDMIVSGGINVYPSDIEEVLRGHSDIADAAVIGAPHEKWGETPIAHVLLRHDATIDPGTVLTWANSRLNKYQRVSEVVVHSTFPRNALGKVIKAELGDPIQETEFNA